jgi:hypothetical protein
MRLALMVALKAVAILAAVTAVAAAFVFTFLTGCFEVLLIRDFFVTAIVISRNGLNFVTIFLYANPVPNSCAEHVHLSNYLLCAAYKKVDL